MHIRFPVRMNEAKNLEVNKTIVTYLENGRLYLFHIMVSISFNNWKSCR